jgi:spermidine synthase
METSLFIDRRDSGLAFYINGDLQFDSADEAIYHEHLVLPTIALAQSRFPSENLRVLVCGGGDGLAVRDVLKFDCVVDVTLVDYSSDIVELARTAFSKYNQNSLNHDVDSVLGSDRVTVHIREAFEFLQGLPDHCYHAVICDFTYPTTSQEADIYSREWFELVRRVLKPGGVVATNGVSPTQRSQGFWCLYQTLFSAELFPKPMRLTIPSFVETGYGDWGFFLASDLAIETSEIRSLTFPASRQILNDRWTDCFEFDLGVAEIRSDVFIHVKGRSQLFYYLLNPQESKFESNDQVINFLDLQERGVIQENAEDPLQMEGLVKAWIAELRKPEPDLAQLLPVQHRYHTQKMTQEWLGYVRSLLLQIDFEQLLPMVLARSQSIGPTVVQEVRELVGKLKRGEPILQISDRAAELMAVLTMLLLMSNLLSPDAVFAKGSYSSSGSSSKPDYCETATGSAISPTGKTCPPGTTAVYPESWNGLGWMGFVMLTIGGVWTWDLIAKRRKKE